MAWLEFLLRKLFDIVSWPSIALLCPLFASFRAINSDSHFKNQQCLAFWALFSIFSVFEKALANLPIWFPFWPYVKGLVIVLLVIIDFRGASFVYKNFIRTFRTYPFVSWQHVLFLIWNILFIPVRECLRITSWLFQRGKCFSFSRTDENIIASGQEVICERVICQGTFKRNDDTITRDQRPFHLTNAQKEWSCALCLISTTSEKCLKKHLQGKKHKARKEEVRAEELAAKLKLAYNSTIVLSSNNGVVLLQNLVNLEKWSGYISPITRPIKWCRWKGPDIGWIKLNTDGSIDREYAGFGGLLRDYNGDAICGFVSKAALNDIFLVELWAIWRGLVLASGLGIKVIWVESDSLSAVKTINKEQSYSQRAAECLNHIWFLLKKFEKHRISHAWRETNKAADYLSRMVLERNDVVLVPVQFPSTLQNIIKDDAQGKIYFRR
ncbi:uncharacterized protein LOC126665493 [Mercurialis annua]|uniref:uncharacterized protein LOC126665493 n=1 Tax=Mercurialis annua TaxID=3986 RepID=UPI002160D44E|nr:uncharacterized protein LOC126665493 [Mercurialis annua]